MARWLYLSFLWVCRRVAVESQCRPPRLRVCGALNMTEHRGCSCEGRRLRVESKKRNDLKCLTCVGKMVTVKRHRGARGSRDTHGTHGRTRAHGSHRRTSQLSKPLRHPHVSDADRYHSVEPVFGGLWARNVSIGRRAVATGKQGGTRSYF